VGWGGVSWDWDLRFGIWKDWGRCCFCRCCRCCWEWSFLVLGYIWWSTPPCFDLVSETRGFQQNWDVGDIRFFFLGSRFFLLERLGWFCWWERVFGGWGIPLCLFRLTGLVWETGFFQQDLVVGGDWVLSTRLGERGEICFIFLIACFSFSY